MSDSNGMDRVVIVAHQIVELRQRLARLEEERAAIENQLAGLVNALAEAAVDAVAPGLRKAPEPVQPQDNSLSGVILTVVNREPNRIFSAIELAMMVNLRDRRSRGNIRTLVARMAKDGRLARVGFGKYMAVPRG